ncbi:MAG: hypothetical protein WCV59_04230 [Parcubacteria group bacterium]|jgi:hypothetical protein
MTGTSENGNDIKTSLAISDYAHYLYTRKIGLPEKYACKNLHTSCLIETSDKVLIFGIMGRDTAISGSVQCVGGGLDKKDIRGNRIDLSHNIKKELMEEVGIEVDDQKIVSSLELKYLKYSPKRNTAAAIFLLKLKISSDEFKKHYENFEKSLAEKGLVPEMGKIVYLKKEKKEIEKFIKNTDFQVDHYMSALLLESLK